MAVILESSTIDNNIYFCYSVRALVKSIGIAYITSLLASFTVELLKFIWVDPSHAVTAISLVGVVVMLHFAKYVFVWAYHGAFGPCI